MNRLTEIKNDVVDAIDMLETRMVDLEREINKVEAELEHTRTVLEALRKDPYEFWICCAVGNPTWAGTGKLTSFTLKEDADAWVIQQITEGAEDAWGELQTLPLPDVKMMRSLLNRAVVSLEGATPMYAEYTAKLIKEFLDENR